MPEDSLGLGCPHIDTELRIKDYNDHLAALRDDGPLGITTRGLQDEYTRRLGDAPAHFGIKNLHHDPAHRLPMLTAIELREGCHGDMTKNVLENPAVIVTSADNAGNLLYQIAKKRRETNLNKACLLYTSPSPRDRQKSRMPSSA